MPPLLRSSKKFAPLLLVLLTQPSSSSATSSYFTNGGGSSLQSSIVSSGLQNLGNTCYLSAQFQCAFHIPLVRNLIVTRGDDKEPAGRQAVRNLFTEMQSAQRPVAPRQLCATLGIPVMEQQDSQEFWKLLLPALQLPALTDLYQGAYEDYIVALDGSGRERRREEPFLDLSLEVSSSDSVVESLQELFGKPEVLSKAEGNGWRPEKGAEKVDAHKGTLLRTQGLSSILQLHLKRFHFDWTTEKTSKINKPFSFPSVLDLSAVCEDTKDDAKRVDDDRVLYDLQAVIVHAGEYGSGHYYAYVRPDVGTDTWYRFNDHVVERVELKDVLRDAYGGKYQLDDENGEEKAGGIFTRLRRAFFSKSSTYGYGGETSNAYVLQYVRRYDIPLLYQLASR